MKKESGKIQQNYKGKTQDGRLQHALLPSYVKVDEQKFSDRLSFLLKYSELVKYIGLNGEEQGSWEVFLQKDICFFLASILNFNLSEKDTLIKDNLYTFWWAQTEKQKREAFRSAFQNLLEMATVINTWFNESQALKGIKDGVKMISEIEQTIKSRPKSALQGLKSEATAAEKAEVFSVGSVTFFFEDFHEVWELDVTMLKIVKPGEEYDFKKGIKKFGSIYRTLFHSITHLQEIALQLLSDSIKKKHNHQPDTALLITFLFLMEHAQNQINTFTKKHLDYYYCEILGQEKLPAVPDKTFVQFTLLKTAPYRLLEKGALLHAGVNKEGLPSYYELDDDILVTKANIPSDGLKTIFLARNPNIDFGLSKQNTITNIYAAPLANSDDGFGAKFSDPANTWPLIGEDQSELNQDEQQMGFGRIGLAIAASVLNLEGGNRKISLNLTFQDSSLSGFIEVLGSIAAEKNTDKDSAFEDLFQNSLEVYLSGKKEWILIENYSATGPSQWENNTLTIYFELAEGKPSITEYNPKVHGGSFDTDFPVLKILLRHQDSHFIYSFVKQLELEVIKLDVEVEGLKSLNLFNQAGKVDGSVPFQPFGPIPEKNAYLLFGHSEITNKKINSLNVNLNWNNLPETENGFRDYYAAYDQPLSPIYNNPITNSCFKINLSSLSNYRFVEETQPEEVNLFQIQCDPEPPPNTEPLSPQTIIQWPADNLGNLQPDYTLEKLPPFTNLTKQGYFKIKLEDPYYGFGESIYSELFPLVISENARPKFFLFWPRKNKNQLPIPNKPFSPVLSQISIDYTASTTFYFPPGEVWENEKESGEKVFHLLPFGIDPIFEDGRPLKAFHGLMPSFNGDGNLFIGIADLIPPQPITIFFELQKSERKFNPAKPISVGWWYLKDNQWESFPPHTVLMDTTDQFTKTGIIKLDIPKSINKNNTILPNDLHWINVGIKGNLKAIGRVKNITTQVASTTWQANPKDITHFENVQANPPQIKISGLVDKTPEITDVKRIYKFYHGRTRELETSFYTRVSELLRHKGRAITPYDYERLILQKFPLIKQVKCIGFANYEKFLKTPGSLYIIVVPFWGHDELSPKSGFSLLQSIKEYVSAIAAPELEITVKNPLYEKILIYGKVKFNPTIVKEGMSGKYLKELDADIKNFICPWLKEGPVNLGGSLGKSALQNFIHDRPYVEGITKFSIVQVIEAQEEYEIEDTAIQSDKIEILYASTPWSVLIPEKVHQIQEIKTREDQAIPYIPPVKAAIETMVVGTDFVIEASDADSMADKDNSKIPEPGPEYFKINDILK